MIFFYYLLALVVIGLDQLTKWLVIKHMDIGQSITIIEGFFYLTSHRNQGAAFGILQGQMWLFYIVTVIVVIIVVYYMKAYGEKSKVIGLSLGLVLGGAIGNFIDRLFRGEVVDFIDTIIFSYDFAIFNIADSALVVGVILLMIKIIVDERKEKGKARHE